MFNKKFILNIISVPILIFMFVFVIMFVSVEAGIIDQEPEPEVNAPDNTTGIPEVSASDHPQVNGEALEMALYEEVNERRLAAGEERLVHAETVRLIARSHSKDMADRGFFDHKNPEGQGSRERHAEFDACDSTNENIARVSYDSGNQTDAIANYIVDGWSESKGHLSIMMSDRPHVTGVGVYVTSAGVIYATQNFCWEHPNA